MLVTPHSCRHVSFWVAAFLGILLFHELSSPTRVTIISRIDQGSTLSFSWRNADEAYNEIRKAIRKSVPRKKLTTSASLGQVRPDFLKITLPSSASFFHLEQLSVRRGFSQQTLRSNEILAHCASITRNSSLRREKEQPLWYFRNQPGEIECRDITPGGGRAWYLGALFVVVLAAALLMRAPPSQPLIYREGFLLGRRAELFKIIGGAALLSCLAVALKISGSSSEKWNLFFPESKGQELLFGESRGVRSDEWMLGTPLLIAQTTGRHAFQIENPSIGAGASALLIGLPTLHPASLVRPFLWGTYLFDAERMISFFWAAKLFLVFSSLLLLLMVLTQSNLKLSLIGAAWVTCSGFLQWWFSTPAVDIVWSFSLLAFSLLLILLSKSRGEIVAGAVLFPIALANFVFVLYPPFQIPFAAVIACLLASAFLQRSAQESLSVRVLAGRILITLGASLPALLLVFLFWTDSRETIDLMRNTVYPGQRISHGGEISWSRYFSGFYEIIFSEGFFPASYGNICEGSNFLLLWPCALVGLLWQCNREAMRAVLPLAVGAAFLSIWMCMGLGKETEAALLLSMVPAKRGFLALGFLNILLVILSLHFCRPQRLTMPHHLGALICTIVVMYCIKMWGDGLGETIPEKIPAYLEALVLIGGGLLVYASLTLDAVLVTISVAAFGIIPNLSVNPLMVGLSPLLERGSHRTIKELVAREPESRWIGFSDLLLPAAMKVYGATVINGTQYAPNLELLRQFDVNNSQEPIYNRFSHLIIEPSFAEKPYFDLPSPDMVRLFVNPCSSYGEKLDFRYAASPTPWLDKQFPCLVHVKKRPLDALVWIYERVER